MTWLAAIGAALFGLYWWAWGSRVETASYRWRVTVTAETSAGPRSGSSVLETSTMLMPKWTLSQTGYTTRVTGEATYVDLGGGRNLVALLALGPGVRDSRISLFVPRAFFTVTEGTILDMAWARELSARTGETRPYGPPTLVTFADPADPATIRLVPFDDPGSVLGPDVTSVRATVTLTRDPATRTIERRLPWIHDPSLSERAFRPLQVPVWMSTNSTRIYSLRKDYW